MASPATPMPPRPQPRPANAVARPQPKPPVRPAPAAKAVPPPKVRFGRFIASDHWGMLGFLLPVVGWGLYTYLAVVGEFPGRRGRDGATFEEAGLAFLGIAIGATLLGAALVAWRLRSVANVLAKSVPVAGTVTMAQFSGDKGRIEYRFALAGKPHNGHVSVHKTKRALALQPGTAITVLVDPARPKRSVIRELVA